MGAPMNVLLDLFFKFADWIGGLDDEIDDESERSPHQE